MEKSQLNVLVDSESARVHWWMNHEVSLDGLPVWNADLILILEVRPRKQSNAGSPAEYFQFSMSTVSL